MKASKINLNPVFAIENGIRQKICSFFLQKKCNQPSSRLLSLFCSEKFPAFSSRFYISIAKNGLKKFLFYFFFLQTLFCFQLPSFAGMREEELIQSTLLQVEAISERSKTLEMLGKETLSQSSTLLDLSSASVPALLKVLQNRKKNWKLRYWATDMLGYVGDSKAAAELLKIVRDEQEVRLIRLRALDSSLEIALKDKSATSSSPEKRKQGIRKKKLKEKLKISLKRIKDVRVKKKVRWAISKL